MEFASLLEAIEHYAEATPDKVCLIEADTDKQFTYSEFWLHIRIFAKRLLDCGLQKGDRVTVRVGPLLETMTAQFGTYLSGGVYCPIGKDLKLVKVVEMLDYFDSKILVSTEKISFDGRWIDLLSALNDGIPLENYEYPKPDDMCAIIFTTGTTGKAKGVMLSYKSCLNYSIARKNALGINEHDVQLWIQPLNMASGIRIFTSTFLTGCSVVYFAQMGFINDFYKTLTKYSVTILQLPQSAISYLLVMKPKTVSEYLKRVRIITLGTAAVSERDKQLLKSLLPEARLFTFYSATEVTPVSFFEFSSDKERANCVGKPHPSAKVILIDSNYEPMINTSSDNLGIVAVESDNIMLGYWKEPDLTAKTVINGRIILTDIGYMDSEGYLYIMGRRDDIITSGGGKIAPYEIEDIAMQVPGVLECACVGVPQNILGSIPKLFVVMKPGNEFSAKTILNYLAERLESFKLPRIIVEIDALPRVGGNQKIDRKVLREIV